MRKFHRIKGRRKSFIKILENNLIMREKIKTTEARAKEMRPLVEKLITLAKKQNLASFRLLLSRLPKSAAEKLYYEFAQRYKDRKGGYLRILKSPLKRKRDASKMALIEFV